MSGLDQLLFSFVHITVTHFTKVKASQILSFLYFLFTCQFVSNGCGGSSRLFTGYMRAQSKYNRLVRDLQSNNTTSYFKFIMFCFHLTSFREVLIQLYGYFGGCSL